MFVPSGTLPFNDSHLSTNLLLLPHYLNLVANLFEGFGDVLVGAFLGAVDDGDGLLRQGRYNFLHALHEADVALDILLKVAAMHSRGCRYLRGGRLWEPFGQRQS